MKSHIELLRMILLDCGIRCCTSTTLDFKRIKGRVEHEGLSYLTITLPQFGKDLQKALAEGKVDTTHFSGYEKRGYLPTFLSGFTCLVFDSLSGRLLDNPSVDAIQCLRQITLMFSKIELPCNDARVAAAIDKYVECEQQVKINDATMTDDQYHRARIMALKLFGDTFARVDRDIYENRLTPKHGPGATADRLKGNRKFVLRQWTSRLDTLFLHSEYLFPSVSHFRDFPIVDLLEPGDELPVRVVTVPKTLKTPRIIAIEPTCMQYMQQAINGSISDAIRRDDILRSIIRFKDQDSNRVLACLGSKYETLATLDLSEASDRVSNQLVRHVVSDFPWLSQGLDVTRSRKADIPGYGVKRLAKFASMGSALCFPIEAIIFTIVVFLGIDKASKRPLTRKDIKILSESVRVYGDDIIVPVKYVPSVIEELQAFGFVVNLDKSFWTGKFRESCGAEYYDGQDVSIVKVKHNLPTKRIDVQEIVSTVELRNRLYYTGFWQACRYLDDLIERLIPFPHVYPTSPGLGRHTFFPEIPGEKECPKLQRPLVRAMRVKSTIPASQLSGSGALLKFFLMRGLPSREQEALRLTRDVPTHYDGELLADKDHLERSGRPERVNIKLGWCPVY